MNQEHPPETINVCITFSPLEGCTLKAICLARDIERCFEIPVHFIEKNDGIFEVTINGISIYKREGVCEARENNEAIFSDIKRYKQPVRDLQTVLPDPEMENDPDYLKWLHSMCSGE